MGRTLGNRDTRALRWMEPRSFLAVVDDDVAAGRWRSHDGILDQSTGSLRFGDVGLARFAVYWGAFYVGTATDGFTRRYAEEAIGRLSLRIRELR